MSSRKLPITSSLGFLCQPSARIDTNTATGTMSLLLFLPPAVNICVCVQETGIKSEAQRIEAKKKQRLVRNCEIEESVGSTPMSHRLSRVALMRWLSCLCVIEQNKTNDCQRPV